MVALEAAVLRTLCYGDIFDYPLTFSQIWQYLISDTPVRKEDVRTTLRTMKGITESDGLYCLSGREKTFALRRQRERISLAKLFQAKRIARVLSFLPSVSYVGISGGLAMHNDEEEGDMDFFIIAASQTIWITRLFSLLIVTVLGKRRGRKDTQVANAVCLNMFLTEDGLSLPKAKQNIYTAHEVVQLVPLVNKRKVYQRFLSANSWVRKYLPNSIQMVREKEDTQHDSGGAILLRGGESIAQWVQMRYMKRHRTIETVSSTMLAFHPKDYTTPIITEYNKKVHQYGAL